MKIFDDFIRNRVTYSNQTESTYNFYNHTNLLEFANVRNRLEVWFESYPESEKLELRSRFKKEFDSAYFELFLYTLFLYNGYNVLVHPTLENSTKRPDFLVKKNNIEIYVEARVVYEMSREGVNIQNIKNYIYDKINDQTSDFFFLSIDELEILNVSLPPSIDKIRLFIAKTLQEADYNKILAAFNDSFHELPKFVYEDKKVKLVVSLIPKENTDSGKRTTLIGIYGAEGKAKIVNPSLSLKKAIEEKAKRYGDLEKPYLIAINALSPWVTYEEDYTLALFGKDSIKIDHINKVFLSSNDDGFFVKDGKYRYSRVSGVLFSKVYTSNLDKSSLILYHHPFPKKSIDCKFLNINQACFKDGFLERKEGLPIKDLLPFL